MARLMGLALESHPRIGSCFVVRFSWNSRVEDPVGRIKTSVPAAEREYDPNGRQWWIAGAHVGLLAVLFENWAEMIAAAARAQPDAFSSMMRGVLRARILTAMREMLEWVPALSGDDLLAALGDAIGRWLDEWRAAAPAAAAAISSAQLGQLREVAAEAREDLRLWPLRAEFVREILAPDAASPEDPLP